MPSRARETVANTSKEEGDRICRMVLQLVRSIAEERGKPRGKAPDLDPVHDSPVYREYQRLVADSKTPGVA